MIDKNGICAIGHILKVKYRTYLVKVIVPVGGFSCERCAFCYKTTTNYFCKLPKAYSRNGTGQCPLGSGCYFEDITAELIGGGI